MALIVVDTETGGFNPATDALLSISACLYDDPSNSITVYVEPDPKLRIESEAVAVNGYTPEKWAARGAVPLKEALTRIRKWMPSFKNDPIAHNATFDRKFIEAAENQAGVKIGLGYHWHCSMAVFMYADKALKLGAANYKLATLAKMAGHWGPDFVRGVHEAAADTLACAEGYRWLVSLGSDMRMRIEALESENASLRQQLIEANIPLPFGSTSVQRATWSSVEPMSPLIREADLDKVGIWDPAFNPSEFNREK